jgi:diketogulonate reductase-like aldo/keto reductase
MIVIPGTSSIAHLEENVAASGIALSEADMDALDRLGIHRAMISSSTRSISPNSQQARASSH